MKRILFFLCLFLVAFKVVISQTKSEKTREGSKMILVLYYSRTGNTKKVAEDIALQLNADIERIIDKKNRSGFWGFLVAGKDALFKNLTQIEKTEKNPADYDIVIIGTPIWAGSMTPAVRTYIIQNKGSFNKIAFFTTASIDKPEKIVKDIEKISNKKVIGFTGFVEKELKSENKKIYYEKLSKFISILKEK